MPARWRIGDRFPRFGFLLGAMLLEIMLAPLLVASAAGLLAARVMTGIVLLAMLVVVGSRRASVGLFCLAVIGQLTVTISDNSVVLVVSAVFRELFLGYVVTRLVWRVLNERNVTMDTVAATACGYMVLGLLWADIYLLLEYWRPGSFYIPSDWVTGPSRDLRATFMYFSFITLTTVGYGVIHPAGPGPGGICVAEAIVGQLYLAIMIARMVGAHLVDRTK